MNRIDRFPFIAVLGDVARKNELGRLREEDLEFMAGLGVEIVLLGTGESLCFLHPRLLHRLPSVT